MEDSPSKKRINSTSVRLSQEQVTGLTAAATKLAKKTKLKVGYTNMVIRAVDEFLARNRKAVR